MPDNFPPTYQDLNQGTKPDDHYKISYWNNSYNGLRAGTTALAFASLLPSRHCRAETYANRP